MREHSRALEKIKKAVGKFELDMSSEVILTEVGSGNYIYSPIIPLLAGAEKVFAWVRDSRYGKAQEIIDECHSLLKVLGLAAKVEFYNGHCNEHHLNTATIITNSGFLRPLDSAKLQHVNSGTVIPIMYEAWELRPDDIDISFATQKNIKIAGTWESHPDLNVFDFVGPLAIKLALQAGFEVKDNRILVWSDDDFGNRASKAFTDFGAHNVIQTTNSDELYSSANQLDFIFLCDYSETRRIEEVWELEKLSVLNPALSLVYLYGNLKYRESLENFRSVFPPKDGISQVMAETLSYVGILPLINLLTAGYKVAEIIRKNLVHDLAQPINYK